MEARLFRGASLPSACSRGLHQSRRAWLRAPPEARRGPAQDPEQARPLGSYYESLLSYPLSLRQAVSRQASRSPAVQADVQDPSAKARVVFGSRLAGPAEGRSGPQEETVVVAGVRVPPRPHEPENCCMSGCVNCVWDRYRDELEAWAAARQLADASLRRQRGLEMGGEQAQPGTGSVRGHAADGTHGDGGAGAGRETGLAEGLLDEALFGGIPVGIREFMKQEKRLKEKHIREGTAA